MGNAPAHIRTTGLPVWQRRLLVALLNVGTTLLILATQYNHYRRNMTFLKGVILFGHALCIPWPVVAFWNAIIGICIILWGNAEKSIYPYFDARCPLPALDTTTALTMFMRNEEPGPIFERVAAMRESLLQTGQLNHFRFVLLSDTDRPDVARMEDEAFANGRDILSEGMAKPLMYRRRSKNVGFKAGNITDYLDHHSDGDDFFVALDSDSTMSGDLLVRMVSTMERYPQIGLLQTLAAGIPAVGAFTRFFTFSMRHTVYTYHMGNTWWTDDCALYWGHNAIIRTKAFHRNCMLPILPGKPPLGGYMLSHDLVEAMFMRRGGYEVRLIPAETESYETQPPTFIDFLRREVRWCQGSMQYWFLLKEPGLRLITRFQVLQTLFTYLVQAFWVVLFTASIARMLFDHLDDTIDDIGSAPQVMSSIVNAFPMLIGILDIASRSVKRYGGGLRYAVSVVLKIILMLIQAPTLSVGITLFICNLVRGKSITWDAQNRDRLGLSWYATFRVLWPQTLLGFGIAGSFAVQGVVPRAWALFIMSGLCLAVPFTVFTASPRVSKTVTRLGLFMVPEEEQIPPVLLKLIAPEIRVPAEADAAKKLK